MRARKSSSWRCRSWAVGGVVIVSSHLRYLTKRHKPDPAPIVGIPDRHIVTLKRLAGRVVFRRGRLGPPVLLRDRAIGTSLVACRLDWRTQDRDRVGGRNYGARTLGLVIVTLEGHLVDMQIGAVRGRAGVDNLERAESRAQRLDRDLQEMLHGGRPADMAEPADRLDPDRVVQCAVGVAVAVAALRVRADLVHRGEEPDPFFVDEEVRAARPAEADVVVFDAVELGFPFGLDLLARQA